VALVGWVAPALRPNDDITGKRRRCPQYRAQYASKTGQTAARDDGAVAWLD
jgi:hypothetical protein